MRLLRLTSAEPRFVKSRWRRFSGLVHHVSAVQFGFGLRSGLVPNTKAPKPNFFIPMPKVKVPPLSSLSYAAVSAALFYHGFAFVCTSCFMGLFSLSLSPRLSLSLHVCVVAPRSSEYSTTRVLLTISREPERVPKDRNL